MKRTIFIQNILLIFFAFALFEAFTFSKQTNQLETSNAEISNILSSEAGLLAHIIDDNIHSMEYYAEKSPNIKTLVDKAKQCKMIFFVFFEHFDIKNPEDAIEFDINELASDWNNLYKSLIQLTVVESMDNIDYSDEKWLQQRLVEVVDSHFIELKIFQTPEKFKSKWQAFTPAQQLTYLKSLRLEGILLVNRFNQLLLEFTRNHRNNKHYNYNFKHFISYENPPKVGEVFKADIFAVKYAKIPESKYKVLLNDKPLKVENGVAKFKFTPKRTGLHHFDMKIQVVNPFTGKTDNFRRRQAVEVF